MEELDDFTKIYESQNGGSIWRHNLLIVKPKEDYFTVEEAAFLYANKGKLVKMLPELEVSDPQRERIFKNSKPRKCPDLFVNDEFVEVKCTTIHPNENRLDNAVRKAKEQADTIFIFVYGNIKRFMLSRIAYKRFEKHTNLKNIIFYQIEIHQNKISQKSEIPYPRKLYWPWE